MYENFFSSIRTKTTTKSDQTKELSEKTKATEISSLVDPSPKKTSEISESDSSKSTLSLNLELENIGEKNSDQKDENISFEKKIRRAAEYGVYSGALSFNKLRPGILGFSLAAMAVTDIAKNGSIGKNLESTAKEQVGNMISEVQQQFDAVRNNAETSLQESIMATSLDEILFNSPTEKALAPTNKFLNIINEEIIKKEQEKQVLLNSTLAYLEDEKLSNLFIREELETIQSQFIGFSLSVDDEVEKVKTALADIEKYSTENYENIHSNMDAYKNSFESAVSSLSNLLDNVSSRMGTTCDRLRANNHGLRGEIVGSAVNMCDDVDGYISGFKNTPQAPNVNENIPQPSFYKYWAHLENEQISSESLDKLKQDANTMERDVTVTLNKSIEALSIREEELDKLRADLQRTSSPIVLPNSESLNAVLDVIENTKSKYRINSGLNHTKQQRIVNDAITEIEHSMNITLNEVIVPTLENFTKKNIDELVSEFEKSADLPIKLLTWGRNLLVGLTVLSMAHKMLEEFEALKPLVKITGKIPFVVTPYKAKDNAGKGPAEVQASRELNIKHPGLKCRLGRTLVSKVLLNLKKPDFLTAVAVYLAIHSMHRMSDSSLKGLSFIDEHASQIDNAIGNLNSNISGILERTYTAKQNAAIEYTKLNQNVLESLNEASQSRADVAEGVKYLGELGVLPSYIDSATGGVYSEGEKSDTSLGTNLTKESMFNITARDIYSDRDFAMFQKVVDDEIKAAKGKNQEESKSQHNWAMGMLILSVVSGCVHEIGKYKDIYTLSEHHLAPKKRFGEFGQRRSARNSLAELALLFNRNDFKVSGKEFLKASAGYMRGNKPQKNEGDESNITQESSQESTLNQAEAFKKDVEKDVEMGLKKEIKIEQDINQDIEQWIEIDIDADNDKGTEKDIEKDIDKDADKNIVIEKVEATHINKKHRFLFLSRIRGQLNSLKDELRDDVEMGMGRGYDETREENQTENLR